MTIRQRLILLVVLTFLALVLVGGFAVVQSRGSSRDVKTVTEGVVPSALASVELMSQLKDVQIATLDLVAAGEANQVEKTQAELKTKQADLQKALRRQFDQADSDTQRGLITQAEESLTNYFASITDTVNFKLAGQKDMAEATLSATVEQYLREQVSIIETVQIEKRRSKDAAIASVNNALGQTTTTLSIVTVLAVLGLTTMGLLLYRQITIPITDMQAKMTEIAQSQDFTHRVPVTREDEIGRSIVAFNAMIEKIQHSSELVKQKNADIHAMLHNIPQGILMVMPGGTVHPEYSSYLEAILETKDIANRPVMELVFGRSHCDSDILSQVDATISACIGEDSMNFDFNSHLLVGEIEVSFHDGRIKVMDLSWSPITDDQGTVARLMLCVWDVTQLRELQAQAKNQKRELAMIGEILAVNQEKFNAFVDGTLRFITDNQALLAAVGDAPTAASHSDTIATLFRNTHTIKGNARTHGLRYLANLVHETEQTYDDMRKNTAVVWDVVTMQAQLGSTAKLLSEYVHINAIKLGRKGPGRRGNVDKFLMVSKEHITAVIHAIDHAPRGDVLAMTATLQRLRHELEMLGTESVQNVLAGVLDSLASLAQELGKEPPRTLVDDAGIVVRSQSADLLKNICVHLYRNSMDHGLEPAAQRLAVGKSAQGCILLQLALDTDTFTMRLSDDGRGLALGAIYKKALANGLVTPEQQTTHEQLAQLIFDPGFTTAQQVTDVSGRGVGMDAVQGFVKDAGGSIALHFTSDDTQGEFRTFETVITLPATFATQRNAHSPKG